MQKPAKSQPRHAIRCIRQRGCAVRKRDINRETIYGFIGIGGIAIIASVFVVLTVYDLTHEEYREQHPVIGPDGQPIEYETDDGIVRTRWRWVWKGERSETRATHPLAWRIGKYICIGTALIGTVLVIVGAVILRMFGRSLDQLELRERQNSQKGIKSAIHKARYGELCKRCGVFTRPGRVIGGERQVMHCPLCGRVFIISAEGKKTEGDG